MTTDITDDAAVIRKNPVDAAYPVIKMSNSATRALTPASNFAVTGIIALIRLCVTTGNADLTKAAIAIKAAQALASNSILKRDRVSIK